MSIELYNLEVEKHLLAGLVQHNDTLAEISIINEKDFSPLNASIFKIVVNEINAGKETSSILLADKIKSYNIQLEGIEPYDYLEALKLIPINEREIVSLAQQLKKLSVLREYEEIGKKIVKKARTSKEDSFADIVSSIDRIFNDKVNQFSNGDDEPQDLFNGLVDEIEEAGNNPSDDGLICESLPVYTKTYGSFTNGDIFVTAARAKSGKSTLLLNLAFDIVNNKQNGNAKVLYLDTEMETYRVRRRMLASISGVSSYHLKTGFWRKNPEMERKVRAAWKIIPNYFNKIDHIYVGGKPFEEVISIIKRWYGKNISRFNSQISKDCKQKIKAAIFFDYLKLGQEMPSNAVKDYVIIGKKVDSLKQVATELQVPVITACQTNRTNEGRKDASTIVDDGSSIGLSDQISQFSSAIMILRKLTMEEMQEFGTDFTHLYIPVYHRELGEDAASVGLVKYLDNSKKIKYRENFIRLKFNNFSVEEHGDFRQWVRESGRAPATEAQIEEAKRQGLL